MRMIRTYSQVKTSAGIKGFRAVAHSTAAPLGCLDQGRVAMGEAKRQWSNQSRKWFAGELKSNARCGVSLKIGRR
jgi:hypothetical protein